MLLPEGDPERLRAHLRGDLEGVRPAREDRTATSEAPAEDDPPLRSRLERSRTGLPEKDRDAREAARRAGQAEGSRSRHSSNPRRRTRGRQASREGGVSAGAARRKCEQGGSQAPWTGEKRSKDEQRGHTRDRPA